MQHAKPDPVLPFRTALKSVDHFFCIEYGVSHDMRACSVLADWIGLLRSCACPT